jgi:DNA-binding XRE family transcriptional regulator
MSTLKDFRIDFIKRNKLNKTYLAVLLGVSRQTIHRDMIEIGLFERKTTKLNYENQIAFIKRCLNMNIKKSKIASDLKISRPTLYRYISDIKKAANNTAFKKSKTKHSFTGML